MKKGVYDFNPQTLRAVYAIQIVNELVRVKFSGSKWFLRAKCWDAGMSYSGFVLVYRSQLQRDRTEYFVPARSVKQQDGKILLEAETDIREVPLQMLYWDIHTVMES